MRLFDVLGPVMIGPSSSHTAGAARIGYTAQKLLGDVPAEADIGLYGSFATTGRGLPLLKSYSSCRTCRKTVAQTVAVIFTKQFCFTIYNSNCTFVAGAGTEPAAVAFFFIYMNDFSDHESILLIPTTFSSLPLA